MQQSMEKEELLSRLADELLPDITAFQETPLRSAASQRELLRSELLTLLRMDELNAYLKVGIEGLKDYTQQTLAPHEHEQFNADMDLFFDNLQHQRIIDGRANSYAELLGLPLDTLKVIDRAGESFFGEDKFDICVGIYALLCVLKHNDPSYWCRKGLSLQGLAQLDEALSCFENARACANNDPGPLLLAADCLMQSGEQQQSENKIREAEKLINTNAGYEKAWKPYLHGLKKYH